LTVVSEVLIASIIMALPVAVRTWNLIYDHSYYVTSTTGLVYQHLSYHRPQLGMKLETNPLSWKCRLLKLTKTETLSYRAKVVNDRMWWGIRYQGRERMAEETEMWKEREIDVRE
jgi:hypothetical protein